MEERQDLISRQAAIDALSTPHGILYPIRTVEELPPAHPERPKGKWIEFIPEHGECPFCGNQVDLLNGKANNFCGECGADMRGEQ